MADFDDDMLLACSSLECESKNFTPPLMFSGNFPKRRLHESDSSPAALYNLGIFTIFKSV